MNHIKQNDRFKITIAVIMLVIFGVLAYVVASYEPLTFDQRVAAWFYARRTPWLSSLLTAITFSANWQSITGICIVLLALPRTRLRYGLPLALCSIVSTIAYEVFKRVFERARPDLSLHLIHQGGFSFPSGHAMTSLVFASVLMLLLRLELRGRRERTLWTVAILLWILLIGASRVYLGVHYPTDILGGWSLGTFIVLLSEQIAKRVSHFIRMQQSKKESRT